MKTQALPSLLLALLATTTAAGCAAVATGALITTVVVTQDRRSMGTVIDDSVVEIRIRERLDQAGIDNETNQVYITSVNGVVLLTGQVRNRRLHDRVLAATRSVPQVRQVINELRVGPPPDARSNARDTWLAGKVKTRLIKASGPALATRINVHVNNGVVYLMGLVTRAEGDRAAGAVRTLRGVKRVVKVFEYVG